MIKRYTRPEMDELWDLAKKFGAWLMVEVAALKGREWAGKVDKKQVEAIAKYAEFTVDRIIELDEGPQGFQHDMNAFVETVKESLRRNVLDEATVNQLHESVTSYDIEDPAFAIQLDLAVKFILDNLSNLTMALRLRATEHKDTLMMGITHGQSAEVITLAAKLLSFVAMLERDAKRLDAARKELLVGKFSGAVGMFGDLTPEIEAVACAELSLEPDKISTQIIHRDRHAALMGTLAVLAGDLEHIANNLWLMCCFPRLEAREPFRATQRGSSRMPHKKNPIILERVRGMASLIRGYQSAVFEHIKTYDERAIDQSCVERVAWPDATTLVHYMLYQLGNVITKMEFFPEVMRANIERTLGQIGSGYVKDMLFRKEIDELLFNGEPKPVYEWVQACSFDAWGKQVHLRHVMIEQGVLEVVTLPELEDCFYYPNHVKEAPKIYAKFGI